MHTEYVPFIIGIIIFLSSLLSIKFGISVAIIEILFGMLAAAFGLKTQEWMIYIAGFGGILLTFLAGTEIDTKLMKEKFKESFLIGLSSFIFPFLLAFLYTFYVSQWSLKASLIAGTTLSTTSLAIVYSVLVEGGLSKTTIGKILMAATFVTNMCSALALSILFIKPNIYTVVFVVLSILILILATKFSHLIFEHTKLNDSVVEPEIKYVFLLLFTFLFLANLGKGQAILPAFLLGLLMSNQFNKNKKTQEIKTRIRIVSYAFIAPMFFIVGGLKVSITTIATYFGLFVILFTLKTVTKFIGVYFLAKKYIPKEATYITLLMSTGLTFGAISSMFGLMNGFIDQTQYSILIGVVIASAIIPTVIAQKWFVPKKK